MKTNGIVLLNVPINELERITDDPHGALRVRLESLANLRKETCRGVRHAQAVGMVQWELSNLCERSHLELSYMDPRLRGDDTIGVGRGIPVCLPPKCLPPRRRWAAIHELSHTLCRLTPYSGGCNPSSSARPPQQFTRPRFERILDLSQETGLRPGVAPRRPRVT